MPKYRITTFSNVNDIDVFFQKFGSTGFCDWFNRNIAGKQNWSGKRITNPSNFRKVWTNSAILLNKDTFNLVEFLCINSIIINETDGSFSPNSEIVGSNGHPGIAYAFDKIPGTKKSYNSEIDNKSAYDLFNSALYKQAHINKPYGLSPVKLADTTDTRWKSDTFPTGFSGNINNETDRSIKTNTFIGEADFMKFRGRGFIQTTGRGGYKLLVDYILNYTGSNKTILAIKDDWKPFGNDLDTICTISTNKQWDDLFQNSDFVVPSYSVWIHSNNAGKYSWIDANQSDINLQKSIRNVASKVSGADATAYINLFYARVMQQLNLIEGTEDGAVSQGDSTPNYQDTNTPQQNQELSRSERTNENPNNGTNQNNNQGGKIPGLTNVFRPTIKPTPIKFQAPIREDEQREVVESLGNFPFVWYNSYQISVGDIEYFKLFTVDNLPMVKIVFRDSLNLMKDKGFPLDDSKIKIFLNPRTQQLKPIFLEFKIVKFNVSVSTYNLTGSIDVNRLYVKNYQSYSQKTSFYAVQDIAKDCGLGFNSNLDDTNDRMSWLNTGQKNLEFLDLLMESSYKSDESILIYYIDFYYCINYVDIEKELRRSIKQELGVSNLGLEEAAKLSQKENISNLFLTNDMSMKNSNGYFGEYRIINNSTSISIETGYKTQVKFYDQKSKNFLDFKVDSITENDKVLMKGAPQDENFYNDNQDLVYTGKLDDDNMHKNYHYSYIQNLRNLTDLGKIGLEVKLQSPNYTIYKFQKIFVFISNQASTPSAPHINNRLTGEWFVIDISFEFDGNKFQQILKLVKRELELSDEERKLELNQTQRREQGERTSNDSSNFDGGSTNPDVPGTTSTLSSNVPIDDTNFPLTKEIFRAIYMGKINMKVVERFYEPMKNAMISYGINTKERIAAFLSQVNAETGNLQFVSELSSGRQYEGRSDLGNTSPGDGVRFKGRGLIQLTGRENYRIAGEFFQKNFVANPTIVADENEPHRKAASDEEQISNAILTSVRFWLKGSTRGNLNLYADRMDITKTMNFGRLNLNSLPETHSEGKKYGIKNSENIATANGSDPNFLNFTIICLGINGGYNGFKDRVENWIKIRSYFK